MCVHVRLVYLLETLVNWPLDLPKRRHNSHLKQVPRLRPLAPLPMVLWSKEHGGGSGGHQEGQSRAETPGLPHLPFVTPSEPL